MRFVFSLLLILSSLQISAQKTPANPPNANVQRPKLVVGIMVDQMRWDYLYRYYDRYAAGGGFKRMINQGMSCENQLCANCNCLRAHNCLYRQRACGAWHYRKRMV